MAAFFDSPRSAAILRVMALLPVIKGFEPLFETLARKELRFGPVVALQTGASLVSLGVGLVTAYLRPDAWALVLAGLSGTLVTTLGAHLCSERRSLGVSFDWRPLKDLRHFGFWIFINGLAAYLFLRGGEWVIGRTLDVGSLALYQMAFLISTTVTMEIGGVVAQLAFPVFSHLQSERDRLEAVFRQSFGMISVITLAMAGLVCVCSPDFYPLVLGNRWLAALPLVPWLAVWGVCSLFAGFMGGLFQALGRLRLWVQTVLVMTVLFAIGVIPLTTWQGARGVAILMAGVGVLMQGVRYLLIGRLLVSFLVYGLSAGLGPRPGLPFFGRAGNLDSGLPALNQPAGRSYFFGGQLVWFLCLVSAVGAALDGTCSPGTVLAFSGFLRPGRFFFLTKAPRDVTMETMADKPEILKTLAEQSFVRPFKA